MFKIQSSSHHFRVPPPVNSPVGLIPFVSTTENTQALDKKPVGNIILSNSVQKVARVWEELYRAQKWGLGVGGEKDPTCLGDRQPEETAKPPGF